MEIEQEQEYLREVADFPIEAALVAEPPAFIPDLPSLRGKSLDDFNGESPCFYLTGEAGTGKTYKIRQHIEHDPSFGVLAATTGIAATNLGAGVPTIHSLLGFGNTVGAEDSYTSGGMLRRLRDLGAQGFQWLIVDEASMLHYKVLDYIVLALDDYNSTYSDNSQYQLMGLMLTGDLCQLPPVPDKLILNGKEVLSKTGKPVNEPTPWLFKAEAWSRFQAATLRLTEVRRQSDLVFIQALNAARAGKGEQAVGLLQEAGANFKYLQSSQFDGTTIVATNDEVDRFNAASLMKVEGEKFKIRSERWSAKQWPPAEWKNIPEELTLKVGALVMILQNDQPGRGTPRRYVNGDLAHVLGVVREIPAIDEDDPLLNSGEIVAPSSATKEVIAIEVQLVRTGEKVILGKITRPSYQLNEPDMDYLPPGPNKERVRKDRVPGMQRRVWIMGELTYIPVRLAYATTVHKSQGLSLDRVQINPSAYFFGNPQMAYVALSRCRTAQGLTIIGDAKKLAGKINSDPVLKDWM